MHNRVTSHLWLKSALHASSHPCMCTCVLRCGCFLFTSPVFYFVPPFSFQPFLMFTSEFNERSRSNPLCDFRLGTVATSDHETPLTERVPKKRHGRRLGHGRGRTDTATNMARIPWRVLTSLFAHSRPVFDTLRRHGCCVFLRQLH